MRELPYILLFVLALSACKDSTRFVQRLDDIDSLMDVAPDSAYSQLVRMHDEAGNQRKSIRMRYELTLAKAQNKNYIDFTTDSVMKQVVEYYDDNGTPNQQMYANYLLGCTYRDLGDAPNALRCYNAAIAKADTSCVKRPNDLLSKVYGQLLQLYLEQRSPLLMIESAHNAIKYAKDSNDTLSTLIYYEYIAEAYEMLGKEDSVVNICNFLYTEHQKNGNHQMAVVQFPRLINIYIKRHDYEKSCKLMRLYEQQSGLFDSQGNISESREIYYDIKGRYYEAIGKYDSAHIYYSKMKSSQYMNCRVAAYRGLMSLAKHNNDLSLATEYATAYCQLTDSETLYHSAEEINRLTSVYNYENVRQQKEEAEDNYAKYKTWTHIFTFGSILAIVLVLYCIYLKNKRTKNNIIRLNKEYSDLIAQLDCSQKELECIKDNVENYKDIKEKEIAELKKAISTMYDATTVEKQNDENYLYKEQAILSIHKKAAKGCIMTANDEDTIEKLCQEHIIEFWEKLSLHSGGLTNKERMVCILTRLRFIPSEIAALLDMTPQSVTNIRAKVNKKLFNDNGAKTFNKHIMSLK